MEKETNLHQDYSKTKLTNEDIKRKQNDMNYLTLLLRMIQLMVEGQNVKIQNFLIEQNKIQPS